MAKILYMSLLGKESITKTSKSKQPCFTVLSYKTNLSIYQFLFFYIHPILTTVQCCYLNN